MDYSTYERKVIMKKLSYLLVLILMVALATSGCSSSSPSPAAPESPQEAPLEEAPSEEATPEPAEEAEIEKRLSETYAEIMKSDKYTMKYRTISSIEGQEVEGRMTMAVDGENYAMVFESDDISTTSVMKDGMLYLIMHDQKMIMAFPAETDQASEAAPEGPAAVDMEGMIYTGKGEAEFMGNMRPYEEYSVEDGTIRYYFEGNMLDGMEMIFDGNSNILDIEELTDKVDETLFVIPEDYQTFKP